MTERDTRLGALDVPDVRDETDPDTADPWAGIPEELLDGTYSYDRDSAGGCG